VHARRKPGERRAGAGYGSAVPSAEHLLAFLLAGVVLVAIPGPSVLFIVGRALAHGRRAALTSVAGNTTGVVLIVVAVALGGGGVPPRRRVFWQGVIVGATNPKVLVLFVALLPQFTDPAAGSPARQMLVLGLLFTFIAATLDSVWGLAAGAARDWFATSPARLRRVGGAGGLMMIGLGTTLALTGRRD